MAGDDGRRDGDVGEGVRASEAEGVGGLEGETRIGGAPLEENFVGRGVFRDVERGRGTGQSEEFKGVAVADGIGGAGADEEDEVRQRRDAEGEGLGTIRAGVAEVGDAGAVVFVRAEVGGGTEGVGRGAGTAEVELRGEAEFVGRAVGETVREGRERELVGVGVGFGTALRRVADGGSSCAICQIQYRPTGPTDVSVFNEPPESPVAPEHADAIVIDTSSDDDEGDEDDFEDHVSDDYFDEDDNSWSAYHSEGHSSCPVSVDLSGAPPSPSSFDCPASPDPEVYEYVDDDDDIQRYQLECSDVSD